jgi:hypothetical protein
MKAFIGILFGITYGLVLRILFDWKAVSGVLEIVSGAFLVVAPFVVGAISIYFASKNTILSVKSQISISAGTMLFFLASMFFLFLEGLICIVLVFPVFMVASIIGGLLMGFIIKLTSKARGILNSLLVLPLFLSPIESSIPISPDERTVETSVIVYANPEEIFSQLASVQGVEESELGFSFMRLIGLPRPLEASMSGSGVGSVRTTKWEKGVTFKERITVWNAPVQFHYQFDIPAGSIPKEALDRHVELGGEYFTVLRGGYDIELIDSETSKLILKTVYVNKSHLKLYGNIWADYVLNDFHSSLLHLMKLRSEIVHNKALLQRTSR